MKKESTETTVARRVARSDYVEVLIRQFPADVKTRLIEEAEASESNLVDVAVGILARHFHVKFFPSERQSPIPPGTETDKLVLRMPKKLRTKINVAAARQDIGASALLIDVLAENLA